ncbi:hypothetical protein [Pararhodospirillum photometricum]|uniref:Uncharacterized protein n=1 Tax=Pararhodospirillum photometricum DSM 122 TaxID=1150469 RepID=H6SMM0_PARPM|nr:hypothetical protein [Pararhodospirillum photometricum]CCG09155.1 unnamed protein product [Pararhodospirillum photometricum DSM 122]
MNLFLARGARIAATWSSTLHKSLGEVIANELLDVEVCAYDRAAELVEQYGEHHLARQIRDLESRQDAAREVV